MASQRTKEKKKAYEKSDLYCRAKAKDLNFNFGQNELLPFLEQWTSVLSCGKIS